MAVVKTFLPWKIYVIWGIQAQLTFMLELYCDKIEFIIIDTNANTTDRHYQMRLLIRSSVDLHSRLKRSIADMDVMFHASVSQSHCIKR